MGKCHFILTTMFTKLMNFSKFYYKDEIHVMHVACIWYWLLAVGFWIYHACIAIYSDFTVFQLQLLWNLCSYSVLIRIFGRKDTLTQRKQQQGKPTDSACLDDSYSWSRMFIIHFRLSFKLNIKKSLCTILRLPFSLDIFVTSCLGNTAVANIFLITI